jgi:hypothetical protein
VVWVDHFVAIGLPRTQAVMVVIPFEIRAGARFPFVSKEPSIPVVGASAHATATVFEIGNWMW